MTPQTRATLVVAVFAAVPAVVLGVIALLAAGPVAGVVVLVVVGVALAAWARFAGDRRVLAAIGGRDADPVSDARLWNLAEGLEHQRRAAPTSPPGHRQPGSQRHGRRDPGRPGRSSVSPPGCWPSSIASSWRRSWPRS